MNQSKEIIIKMGISLHGSMNKRNFIANLPHFLRLFTAYKQVQLGDSYQIRSWRKVWLKIQITRYANKHLSWSLPSCTYFLPLIPSPNLKSLLYPSIVIFVLSRSFLNLQSLCKWALEIITCWSLTSNQLLSLWICNKKLSCNISAFNKNSKLLV